MNERQNGRQPKSDLLPIGSVVRRLQETHPSVSQSSLRFLEREGLIEPTRTPGGHRLYSEADIERIQQIKAWQDQRLSLDQIRERLEQRDRLPHPGDLADGFLQLILSAQLADARALLLHADSLGMPLAALFGEVLQPVLYEVGLRWEDGRMLVAQEKETSELARDLIAELSQRHDATQPDGPSLVAGSVQGERHELGLRMISGLLRSRGCRVHYLGADVAHEFFIEAVELHQPDAVLISVKLEANVEQVGAAAERIRAALAADPAPPILAGGEAVASSADHLRQRGVYPIVDTTLDGVIDTVMGKLPSSAIGQDVI
ncbi:MAG TPA: cobalamin-dependent protein [Thermomicrobiales bacterium]|nr:cobalamin-dependent protein [Thermomicrobiales bacterium]